MWTPLPCLLPPHPPIRRWGKKRKKGHPFLLQLRLCGPHVGEGLFAAVAVASETPKPEIPKPTDTLHFFITGHYFRVLPGLSCYTSRLIDTGSVRRCVMCILARKWRRAKIMLKPWNTESPVMWRCFPENDWKCHEFLCLPSFHP